MSVTILAPTTVPANGVTLTSAQTWADDTVLVATAGAPASNETQPCIVKLLLSSDGISYVPVSEKSFGLSPAPAPIAWKLADFAAYQSTPLLYYVNGVLVNTSIAANASRNFGPPWSNWMLRFVGNTEPIVVGVTADSGVLASPASITLTAAIDTAFGSTQGDILVRGSTSWLALVANTAGYVLTSNGAATVPSWQAASGGGSGTVNSGTAPEFAYYATTGTAVSGAASILVGAQGQLNQTAITPSTQVAGDSWFDATQLCKVEYTGSATSADCLDGYSVRMIYQQNAVVTITAAASTTMISTTSATGTVSLPAGYLNVLNRTLRVTIGGYASTAASTPGNITDTIVKLGSNIVATSGGTGLNASKSNLGFAISFNMSTKATGASGKLDTSGMFTSGEAGGSYLGTNGTLAINNGTVAGTIAGTQTTLDLTAAYVLDFQLNLSATGNTFVVTNVMVEVIG